MYELMCLQVALRYELLATPIISAHKGSLPSLQLVIEGAYMGSQVGLEVARLCKLLETLKEGTCQRAVLSLGPFGSFDAYR